MPLQEQNNEQTVAQAVRRSQLSMVLTDPRVEDNPITYVNGAFESLTLYSREFAIGRNCRFLQGPETDPRDVDVIREGLRSEEEFQVTITNHRADGTPFRNQLLVTPIHDSENMLTGFFGVQRDIGEVDKAGPVGDAELLRELQHRVKNHLAMIVSMIRIQASREVTPESLKAVSRRIEALGLLYEELLNSTGNGNGGGTREIAAGSYLSRIASVVASLEARPAIRVNVECSEISLAVDQAARLGLLLSEFLTNALQHAFEDRKSGFVEVRFFRLSDGSVRLSVEDDGIGMPEGDDWPFGALSIEAQRNRAETAEGQLDTRGRARHAGVGGSIVAALTQSLGAELHVARPKRGTIITVDFDAGA